MESVANLEVLYFLKLCPIFVGPTLCQNTKYSNFLEAQSFFDKNQASFIPPSQNQHNPPNNNIGHWPDYASCKHRKNL